MGEPLSITLRLLLIVALVLANGLFVAAEFSIVTTRRARMESRAAQANPFARLVSRAIDNVNNYLAATQLGITMASIGLGWVGEPLLAGVIEPAFDWLPGGGGGTGGLNALANATLRPFGLRAPTGATPSVRTAEEIQWLMS